MKAVLKYKFETATKELTVTDFKAINFYSQFVEVRSTKDGLEQAVRIPSDDFVSINITK